MSGLTNESFPILGSVSQREINMQDQGKTGSGSGFGQTGSMGKGLSAFLSDPKQVDAIVREGYIQQASVGQTDQQAVRNGDWDSRIEGFDLARHTLQHAEELITKVPQTA